MRKCHGNFIIPFLMCDLITLEWSGSNLARFVVATQSNYNTIRSLNIITKKILDIVNMEKRKKT